MAESRFVKRLPVDTGVSGWCAVLPEPGKPTVLQSEIKADFLIVGAGFAGLSAARRLNQLEPDARIVVLEAKRIAEGPAGRNSGFMIDLPHDVAKADYSASRPHDEMQIGYNRMAIGFAAGVAREYGLPKEAFDPCGKINGAAAEAAIRQNEVYAEHLKQLGEPFRMLDAAAMKKLTGSGFYRSGLYTPGTALLQPAMYIRGLAKGLANRVSVYENSPVIALSLENGNWVAASHRGSVTAPKTVLATNGHIESFGHYKRRLVHVMLYASMTRSLDSREDAMSGEPGWGITPSDPAATTMRKISGTGGTRIITRNRVSYSPSLQVDDAMIAGMAKSHDKSFANRYPQLGNVSQEYRWAGRLCLSLNGVSAFGEVQQGLYSACCQNGLGTARGTLSGMAVAELACAGKTELVRYFLKAESPKKLPVKPFDWMGATAFMRWSEFRARKEM